MIQIVATTRLSEADFWSKSALGRSLHRKRSVNGRGER